MTNYKSASERLTVCKYAQSSVTYHSVPKVFDLLSNKLNTNKRVWESIMNDQMK